MKNIAIVGIGHWGKVLLKEFSKTGKVTACCSRGGKKNISWVKKYYPDISFMTNYTKILNDKNISAVVLAVPISSHFKMAKAALLKDKHVFIEKPLSTKIEEAEELINLAKKKGKIIQVGYEFLYHEIFKKVKEILKNEEIKFINFEWNKFGSFTESLVWNLLSHDVSIICDVVGEPSKATFLIKTGVVSDCDIACFKFEFNSSVSCSVFIDRTSKEKNKRVTFVTKNKILLWENDFLYELDGKSNRLDLIVKSNASSVEEEAKDFVSSIEKNTDPYCDGALGLKVTRVISGIID